MLVALGGGLLLGAAGMQFGPIWLAAGVLTGVIVAPVTYLAVLAMRTPTPEKMLKTGRLEEALQLLESGMPTARVLARKWPGQFPELLADRLTLKAEIQHTLNRVPQALDAADEAVDILTELAENRPGRYDPELARVLCLQAGLLAVVGRHGEALGAAETAAALYRDLAVIDRAGYVALLAVALERQADALGYLDRVGQARAIAATAALIRSDMMPGHAALTGQPRRAQP